jgi:hypothetical protein
VFQNTVAQVGVTAKLKVFILNDKTQKYFFSKHGKFYEPPLSEIKTLAFKGVLVAGFMRHLGL